VALLAFLKGAKNAKNARVPVTSAERSGAEAGTKEGKHAVTTLTPVDSQVHARDTSARSREPKDGATTGAPESSHVGGRAKRPTQLKLGLKTA